MRFRDRVEAGKLLAVKLSKYKGKDSVVYAIPRGGVVLGVEIAKEIGAPLDLVITRKIGHPNNPEYALCVVAEDGHMECNEIERRAVDKKWLAEEMEKEKKEAKRRREKYLGERRESAKGKVAILVDDGVATGMTFLMAIRELRHLEPDKIVAALPVMPIEMKHVFEKEVDELVTLEADSNYLGAVGAYYDDFPQVEDEEVIRILKMPP